MRTEGRGRMLRGAFIGFGNVAANGHLPGWLARDDVEIVAAADIRADGRRPFAESLPGARWYGSTEEMLESETLDFVDVCTPPAFHAAAVRSALERNLHVLCEKPLLFSPEEIEDLGARARRRGRVLTAVHNWRYAPVLARATGLVASGTIGAIRRCRWETLRDRPAAPAGSSPEGNWRVDPAVAGGGILLDHGWHALYVIRSWLAGEPEWVSAKLETRAHHEWQIEDTAEVFLEYPKARAEIFLTWTAPQRANRVYLEGMNGEISIDGGILEVRPAKDAPAVRAELPGSLAKGSHHPDWFAGVIGEFLQEIRDPTRRGASLSEAQCCARWICLAQESSRLGGKALPTRASAVQNLGATR